MLGSDDVFDASDDVETDAISNGNGDLSGAVEALPTCQYNFEIIILYFQKNIVMIVHIAGKTLLGIIIHVNIYTNYSQSNSVITNSVLTNSRYFFNF